ncbi:MAG: hypothetical protein GY870_15850 [archaeon]|nr:hypothetical protein [archaeon]
MGLVSEDIEILITGNPLFLLFLGVSTVYFLIYFLLSLTTSTSKLIISIDNFFGSLLRSIIWYVLIFFLVLSLAQIFNRLLIYIVFPGTLIWALINAAVLNGTFMGFSGLRDEAKFSWLKFIFSIFIIIGSLLLMRILAQLMPFLIFWYIIGVVFAIFVLIFPKKALSTALYYIIMFLYFSVYVIYYNYSESNGSNPNDSSLLIVLDILILLIQYAIFFMALGKIQVMADFKKREHKKYRSLTLFTIYSSFSYVTFEFTRIQIENYVPTDDYSASLQLLVYRFVFVWLTAVIVYLYTIFRSKKENINENEKE